MRWLRGLYGATAYSTLTMQVSLLLFGLLAAVIAFAVVAKRLALPYPIVFVVGGALIALIPNLPALELDPDWVFLIILPPLLFSGGWTTDWRQFRFNLRPILLLAIGLVMVTTAAVAVVAHAMIPSLGWAGAFTLGAIVSPPDAVAAVSVFERFNVPRRIVTVLDGEGLINDASALVIYRFAVAAAVTGTFSPGQAGLAFVVVVVGGVAIGLAVSVAIDALSRLLARHRLADSLLDNVIFLLAPYAAYLPAEAVHVSGVLATVIAGIYIGRRSSTIYEPESRLVGVQVWNLLTFVFNGVVFLLIGLQLRATIGDPSFAARLLYVALGISAVVIVVRVLWVYPATYLPRWLSKRLRRRDPLPPWRWVAVIAYTGMRGIVSLAAALALPLQTAAHHAFPGRAAIIFVTFCVIFVTLVVQGLLLIPLIRWLGLEEGEDGERREIEVRVAALRAGLKRLHQLEAKFDSTDEWVIQGRIAAEYEFRIEHLLGHASGRRAESTASRIDHHLEREALSAERHEIMRLRDNGDIPDEIFRKVQYELDLAQARLT